MKIIINIFINCNVYLPKIIKIPINNPEDRNLGSTVTPVTVFVVVVVVLVVVVTSLTSVSVLVKLQDGAPSCSRVLVLVLIFIT